MLYQCKRTNTDAPKYEQRLEEARSSLLQSIGVGGAEPLDGYEPDWASKGKAFDANMAALLAHAAFESYNDPAGGKWEVPSIVLCLYNFNIY